MPEALLPTPRATDGTNGTNGGPNQRGSSGDMMLPSAVQRLLPTPMAADGGLDRGSSAGYGLRNVSREIARRDALLPTPRASDTGTHTEGSNAHAGTALTDALTLLPTPQARDGEKGCPGDRFNESNLVRTVERLLPTPRTSDTNGGGTHGSGGPDLRTVIGALTDSDGRSGEQRRVAASGETEGGRARRAAT